MRNEPRREGGVLTGARTGRLRASAARTSDGRPRAVSAFAGHRRPAVRFACTDLRRPPWNAVAVPRLVAIASPPSRRAGRRAPQLRQRVGHREAPGCGARAGKAAWHRTSGRRGDAPPVDGRTAARGGTWRRATSSGCSERRDCASAS
jgi:hypothetical protein